MSTDEGQDDVAELDVDEEDVPAALADLLKEVAEFLEETASGKRAWQLQGKVQFALENWFEEDDDFDDDLDEEDEEDGDFDDFDDDDDDDDQG